MKLFIQLLGVWVGTMWCFTLATRAAEVFSNEQFRQNATFLGVISLFWFCSYGIICAVEHKRNKQVRR